MQFITDLFNHYGYIVLFVSLMLELIAFPTPGESLLTYCGFLVSQGKLNWGISIIVAALGVITGITISYFVSRSLETSLFRKYGSFLHIKPDKLEKISQWFERYGNGLLVVAYFIPGVRHITGYFSGIAGIPYKKFALNAYTGAFIWTSTFITLGKILGLNWERFHNSIKEYLIIGGIILIVILLVIYFYRIYKTMLIDFVMHSLENSVQIYRSLGKIKLAIVGIAAIFVTLSIVLIGLIQDFLANQFTQFDMIVTYIVSLSFPENWTYVMGLLKLPTAVGVLLVVTLLTFIWIILKGWNRLLETRYLIVTVLGGAVLEAGLRIIFHRLDPLGGKIYTFPSQQAFLAVVVYGFASFMVLRHAKNRWLGTFLLFMTLGISAFTGLSIIFLNAQYPSDILAGYVLGGVWLSLNIVLMEAFRALSKLPFYQKLN